MNELEIKRQNGLGKIAEDALKIRDAVFIGEQGVSVQREHDGADQQRMHYVGYLDGKPATTARVLINGANWHIERVATLKTARGSGHAQRLMRQIMDDASQSGIYTIDLNAQMTAMPFYEKLGFVRQGEVFVDAGMDHVEMQRTLSLKEEDK
ncbi:GNAT family N-acetyltransferase [Weissella viridescens]|uniref:GNAT family N-acetyltransferase n=1 Tax=Weissella viridescens TaxID=1629 RepID=A0A3P2RDR8_WEIVI|nr:GNAT family N-acetyltransferase [Weissella viridescens]RRG18774.1 GNAT family N-acetyltransferase [Weissella viridescens]